MDALMQHPRLERIGESCQRAAISFGWTYSPCELWTIAWFCEDADAAIATYELVAALGRS